MKKSKKISLKERKGLIGEVKSLLKSIESYISHKTNKQTEKDADEAAQLLDQLNRILFLQHKVPGKDALHKLTAPQLKELSKDLRNLLDSAYKKDDPTAIGYQIKQKMKVLLKKFFNETGGWGIESADALMQQGGETGNLDKFDYLMISNAKGQDLIPIDMPKRISKEEQKLFIAHLDFLFDHNYKIRSSTKEENDSFDLTKVDREELIILSALMAEENYKDIVEKKQEGGVIRDLTNYDAFPDAKYLVQAHIKEDVGDLIHGFRSETAALSEIKLLNKAIKTTVDYVALWEKQDDGTFKRMKEYVKYAKGGEIIRDLTNYKTPPEFIFLVQYHSAGSDKDIVYTYEDKNDALSIIQELSGEQDMVADYIALWQRKKDGAFKRTKEYIKYQQGGQTNYDNNNDNNNPMTHEEHPTTPVTTTTTDIVKWEDSTSPYNRQYQTDKYAAYLQELEDEQVELMVESPELQGVLMSKIMPTEDADKVIVHLNGLFCVSKEALKEMNFSLPYEEGGNIEQAEAETQQMIAYKGAVEKMIENKTMSDVVGFGKLSLLNKQIIDKLITDGFVNSNYQLTNKGRRVVKLHEFCFNSLLHPFASVYAEVEDVYKGLKASYVLISDVMFYTNNKTVFEKDNGHLPESLKDAASINEDLTNSIANTIKDTELVEYKPYAYCPGVGFTENKDLTVGIYNTPGSRLGFVVLNNFVNNEELYIDSMLLQYIYHNHGSDVVLTAQANDPQLLFISKKDPLQTMALLKITDKKELGGLTTDTFALYDRQGVMDILKDTYAKSFLTGISQREMVSKSMAEQQGTQLPSAGGSKEDYISLRESIQALVDTSEGKEKEDAEVYLKELDETIKLM